MIFSVSSVLVNFSGTGWTRGGHGGSCIMFMSLSFNIWYFCESDVEDPARPKVKLRRRKVGLGVGTIYRTASTLPILRKKK